MRAEGDEPWSYAAERWATLARGADLTRATNALLRGQAGDLRAAASRIRANAIAMRLASRPASHYAHLVGEMRGVPMAAVVRHDGSATTTSEWLEAAGLSSRGPAPRADGREPLRTTLSLSRSCDRLLHIRLLDAGQRSRASGPDLHAVLPGRWEPLIIGSAVFAIEVISEGAVRRVQLVGELDMAAAPTVQERLVEMAGPAVEVDLAHLTFLDGRGLSALLGAKERVRAAGHTFRIVGAEGIVRRVFDVTGLSSELDD